MEKKQNLPLILSIAALVGIVVLFILHFRSQQLITKDAGGGGEHAELHARDLIRVAYVNSDSIMAQYELVGDMRRSLELSTRQKEESLRKRQRDFEAKVDEFQQRVSNNLITMDIAQIQEQQLLREQQELVDLRDRLAEELAHEEFELNIQLFDSVSNFLTRYNTLHHYDIIFNNKPGTIFFLANEAFDITAEVIEALNAEYRLSMQNSPSQE